METDFKNIEALLLNNEARLSDKDFALELDKNDPLKDFRDNYHIPKTSDLNPQTETSDEDSIYFCGNSLGLQSKNLVNLLNEELDKWGKIGVRGHFTGKRPWLTIDDITLTQLATITGSKTKEIAPMNTLTVNLHIGITAFYRPKSDRFKILVENTPFPSDLYAVHSQVKYHGYDESSVVHVPVRKGSFLTHTEDVVKILEEQGHEIALVFLPGVHHLTGQFLEIEKITKVAHDKGCFVGFDLAHAVGNVELRLHDWGVDFACWCSYKYLNAGPGTIGGFFVHEKHFGEKNIPKFEGWWGQSLDSRMQFNAKDPDPLPGAYGFRNSNPSVLNVMSLYASLEDFEKAGMKNLRRKSILLTGYLEKLLLSKLGDKLSVVTPKDPTLRGCQLSLDLGSLEGKKLEDLLIQKGVVCDLRENILRVAPTPLYNTFYDVFRFVGVLSDALGELRT